MAFPTVASHTGQAFATSSTTHNVSITADAGDLVIVSFATDNQGVTHTTPTDWTLLLDQSLGSGTGGGRFSIFARSAPSGWEGGTTVDFQTSGSEQGAAVVLVVDAGTWSGTVGAGGVELSAAFQTASDDTASVTASWGSDDNLFVAQYAHADDDIVGTAAPTNYASLVSAQSGASNGAAATILSATRSLASASDDPDAFAYTGTPSNKATGTIVIRPAAAASVTKEPATAVLTLDGRAPSTNAFTYVAIQDTLINESGQAIASAANIRLMVWYSGQLIGLPDYSVNGQTSDASGSISWSVTPGTLVRDQEIFFVAQDSVSYSNYTCGRITPTYG